MFDRGILASILSQRPFIIVLAGPNGAGKSTLFETHLAACGLRFVNADVLARALDLEARQAAAAADALRAELIRQRESFVTETVFSDPVGAKLGLFTTAMQTGYHVVLLFVGISGPIRSDERVSMRVSKGGHDVPADRLIARYPRTLANLRAAIPVLTQVIVFDNDDVRTPYQLIAHFSAGKMIWLANDPPAWWRAAQATAAT